MLIPYSTDAPVYHRPYGTVGLIVLNCIVYFGIEDDTALEYILWWGDGLHPVQWVTSNFIHGDFWHLFGNMIFLWTFGLVIEGKLGWWRFLAVYLGMGVAESGGEQILFQEVEELSGSYGASAILFGLLAMCMIWAPKNEVRVFYWILRPGTFSMTLQSACIVYLVLELVPALLSSEVSSAALHLTGAALGFPIAIIMLKLGWVDCESWDWFSLRAGRHVEQALAISRGVAEEHHDTAPTDLSVYREMIRDSLDANDVESALEVYRNSQLDVGRWQLDEPELADLALGLFAAQSWKACLPLMGEYVKRFPDGSASVRVRYAGLLCRRKRPHQVAEILASIPEGSLSRSEEQLRAKFAKEAQRQIEGGALEFE